MLTNEKLSVADENQGYLNIEDVCLLHNTKVNGMNSFLFHALIATMEATIGV